MEGDSLELKMGNVNDEGAKRQDIELTKFLKYTKFVPELRRHILKYCNDSTLFNYSQLSKICNSEIQMFNTVPPYALKIAEEWDGVSVEMKYWNRRLPMKTIFKKFMFSDFEDVLEEVQKYLLNYYKYVKNEKTRELTINLKRIPTGIMQIKPMSKIKSLTVTMCKSIYNDWLEYFKSIDASGMYLYLHDCVEVSERVIIPADFFKSGVFQRLEEALFWVKCEIDSEDFLRLENGNSLLIASVSFDDIRAKVRNWNSESYHSNHEGVMFCIRLPDDDDRVFDMLEIFPTDQFVGRPFIYYHNFHDVGDDDGIEGLIIGRVEMHVEDDGKTLCFSVRI